MQFHLQGNGDPKHQLFGDYCHSLRRLKNTIQRQRAGAKKSEKNDKCHSTTTSSLDAPMFWFKGCRLPAWPDHQRKRGSPSCLGLPKEERRKPRDGGSEMRVAFIAHDAMGLMLGTIGTRAEAANTREERERGKRERKERGKREREKRGGKRGDDIVGRLRCSRNGRREMKAG